MAAASGGCLLITSQNESFGMTAAEALACRCPVVASRVGALPDLLTGPLAQGLFGLGALDAPAGKLRRMVMAENVTKAYKARAEAEDWVAWARDNPEINALLNQAMKAANNGESS
jgi:glycosyltransferase involved in cell wall biosynthesis